MRSFVVATVALVLTCQPAAAPAELSATPRPQPSTGDTKPALDLNGPLRLDPAGTLGLGGRQIVFLDDQRWLSSAGYQVTWWDGHVPKTTFHLDAYNYLAASADGAALFGDREVVTAATGAKSPASVPAVVAGGHTGLAVQTLRVPPDRALGLLELDWRAGRGMPVPVPDGVRLREQPPDAVKHWYIVDPGGRTLVTLPAGNSPFSAFSPKFVAIGGTPTENELTVLARPGLAPAATLSLGGTYINQVDISRDERWLLAADNTGKVAVWDTANWRAPPMAWAAHAKPTGGIAFHPRAPLLVTTGFDQTVKLWRLGAPPVLVASAPLAGLPLAVAFTPNGERLYVGVDRHDNITESIVIFALAPGA